MSRPRRGPWSGSVRALVAAAGLAVVWAAAFGLTDLAFFPLIATGGILTGLAGLWVRRGDRVEFPTWRLTRTDAALAVGVAVAHVIVAHALFALGVALFPGLAPTAEEVYGRTGEITLWLALLIGGALTAPLEEVFWRGAVHPLLATHLRARLPGRIAARGGTLLAGALAYAAFHVATGSVALVAAALLGGLVWGWLLEHTRSLGPPMLAHAVWACAMLLLPPV